MFYLNGYESQLRSARIVYGSGESQEWRFVRQKTTMLFQSKERMQRDDLRQKTNDLRIRQKVFGKNKAIK